jgi:hypothetical protein
LWEGGSEEAVRVQGAREPGSQGAREPGSQGAREQERLHLSRGHLVQIFYMAVFLF